MLAAARSAAEHPAMHSAALVEHWEDATTRQQRWQNSRSWNSASLDDAADQFLGTLRTLAAEQRRNAREALLMKTAPPAHGRRNNNLGTLSPLACPIDRVRIDWQNSTNTAKYVRFIFHPPRRELAMAGVSASNSEDPDGPPRAAIEHQRPDRQGQEQGFLLCRVNDHLPDSIVDPRADRRHRPHDQRHGHLVHETAPESDDQTLSDNAVSADDDAAGAAAAALATVDSEFGRTTDPVRMYMREMGTVELLTREGELRIARRIEDGLNQVSVRWPPFHPPWKTWSVASELVDKGEIRLPPTSSWASPCRYRRHHPETRQDGRRRHRHQQRRRLGQRQSDDDDDDSSDDEPDDNGLDPTLVAERIEDLRKQFKGWKRELRKSGNGDKSQKCCDKTVTAFLEFRLVPQVFSDLTDMLRDVVSRVREHRNA